MNNELSVEDLAAVHGGGVPFPYPVGPGGDVGWVQTDVKPSEVAGAIGAGAGAIPGGQGVSAIAWLGAIILNHFGE